MFMSVLESNLNKSLERYSHLTSLVWTDRCPFERLEHRALGELLKVTQEGQGHTDYYVPVSITHRSTSVKS